MKKSNLFIRPMDIADIEKVVMIHSESFPTSRSTKLGKPFLRKMYEWYIFCQPRLSFVALQDDRVVGFVTGTMGESEHQRFKYAFWCIVWGFLRNPALFLYADMFEEWKSYIEGLLPTRKKVQAESKPTSTNFTLDSIAVYRDARGFNVGRTLVYAFEEAAKLEGATYLALGVEYDNRAARRLYERCGWKLDRETVENNSANYIKEVKRT